MTFSRIVWALCLLLVLVVGLVSAAPARLLTLVIPGEQVVLSGLSGTLWQGAASRCLLRLPSGYLHLGAVQWRLSPLSVLLARPELAVSSKWGEQSASGDVALRGAQDVNLENFEGRADADLLRQFAPVALAGSFSLQVDELQVRKGRPVEGSGRVVWQNAAWRSPAGPVRLGDYALDFAQVSGEPLRGEVQTLSGPMEASGDLELDKRSYRLNVLISSQEAMDKPIREALSLMAAPEGDGYRVKLNGDL